MWTFYFLLLYKSRRREVVMFAMFLWNGTYRLFAQIKIIYEANLQQSFARHSLHVPYKGDFEETSQQSHKT